MDRPNFMDILLGGLGRDYPHTPGNAVPDAFRYHDPIEHGRVHEMGSTDWLISVDDHVVEPPNVWTDRLPSKYADVMPRVVTVDGDEHWVYEDMTVHTGGAISATIGLSREQ